MVKHIVYSESINDEESKQFIFSLLVQVQVLLFEALQNPALENRFLLGDEIYIRLPDSSEIKICHIDGSTCSMRTVKL